LVSETASECLQEVWERLCGGRGGCVVGEATVW
jgi:hypothetical protein